MRYSAHAWIVLLVMTVGGCTLAPRPARIHVQIDPGSNPWTSLDLNNDPEHFQFAIVTDNTGGMRPGVFEDGVAKLNLLQPEFVMSVGDLIDGYTEDRELIDRQWKEFIGFTDALEMPFFYLPGNHDISNLVMEEEWIERFGRTYYHFVFRDVLFLCLDSEDPPDSHIGDEQREYVARALAENPDVRWTLVFLHKPLWDYGDETGWRPVEELLKDRPHTVFAGHRHRYLKFERNDQSYIMLATTGGGSRLRGPAFGQFDHVVWITMTDGGPRIANLMLDGIWDENILTEDTRGIVASAVRGRSVSSDLVIDRTKPFEGASTRLRLTNDADIPMRVTGRLLSTRQVAVSPTRFRKVVPPNSVEFIDVELEAREPVDIDGFEPIAVEWEIGYTVPNRRPLVVDGVFRWAPPEEEEPES